MRTPRSVTVILGGLLALSCSGHDGATGSDSRASALGTATPTAPILNNPQILELTPPPFPILSTESDNFAPNVQVDVDRFGAATVRVPLWVPQGRRGVEPEISLEYSSRAQYSHAGWGWRLTGIPTISRCVTAPADSASGAAAPINYGFSVYGYTGTPNPDQLCLDGEPLVPEPNAAGQTSNALAAGNFFRTYHDRFLRIMVVAVDPEGPTTFRAYRNDGMILTFGGGTNGTIEGTTARYLETPSQYIQPQGVGQSFVDCQNNPASCTVTQQTPARLAWGLTSIEDRNANHLDIQWLLNSQSQTGQTYSTAAQGATPVVGFEWVPSQISYTSNLLSGQQAQRTVLFGYSPPTSDGSADYVERRYVAGVPVDTRTLLRSIILVAPNPTTAAVVKKYNLQYAWDNPEYTSPTAVNRDKAQTRIPVLTGLTECDAAGVCKPGLEFDYYADPLSFEAVDNPPAWTELALSPAISDLVDVQPFGRWRPRIYTPDLDNDGRSDLLYWAPATPGYMVDYYARLSSGTGFGAAITTTINTPYVSRMFPFEFLGTGNADVLVVEDAVVQPHPEVRSWNGSTLAYDRAELVDFATLAEIADLDGDGLGDLIYTTDTGRSAGNQTLYQWNYALNKLQGFSASSTQVALPLSPDDHRFIDVDGDGASEILSDDSNTGRFFATHAGTTSYWRAQTTLVDYPPQNRAYLYADLNGDGLKDVVDYDTTKTTYDTRVWINSGNGFFPPQAIVPWNGQPLPQLADHYVLRVIDFNNDGKQDLLLRKWIPDNISGDQNHPIVLMYNQDSNSFTAHIITEIGELMPTPPPGTSPPEPTFAEMIEVTDVNGDGLNDIIMKEADGNLHVFTRGGYANRHRLLKTVRQLGISRGIVNGQNVYAPGTRYDFTYTPLTDSTVYTSDSTCIYPQKCQNGGMWIASQLTRGEDAYGGTAFPVSNTYSFSYKAAVTDQRGRGFLGFRQFTKHDAERKTDSILTFNFAEGTPTSISYYPFADTPSTEEIDTSLALPGPGLQYKTHTVKRSHALTVQPTAGAAFFVYPSSTIEDEFEVTTVGQTSVHHWVTSRTYDNNGSQTYNETDREDSSADIERHTLTYDNTDFWPRITQSVDRQTSTTHNGSITNSLTRTRTLTFDTQWRLQSSVALADAAERDHGEQTLNVSYGGYTTEGLLSSVTASESTARGGASRSLTIQYDSLEGMRPVIVIDGLGHYRRYAYDTGLTLTTISEDEGRLQTHYEYDGFGRIRHEIDPDGKERTWNYGPYNGDPGAAPINSDTLVRVRQADVSGPKVLTEYNWREKPTLIRTYDRDDGQQVLEALQYDQQDRLSSRTQPAFSTTGAPTAQYNWDPLDRLTSETRIDGSTWTYAYDALQVQETDGRGNNKVYLVEGQHRLAGVTEQVQDLNGTNRNVTTNYSYGPFGSIYSVTDSQGNQWTNQINRLGTPYHTIDPDADHTTAVNGGQHWFYPNAFGDVEQSITSNYALLFGYDGAGRLSSEKAGTRIQTYQWDTSLVGRIGAITSLDGITTTFAYDSTTGVLTNKTWTIGTEQFALDYSYTPNAELYQLTYPAIQGAASRFAVRYMYGNYGALKSVVDASTAAPYWTLSGITATGFTTENFGNGSIVTTTETESVGHHGELGEIKVLRNTDSMTLYDTTFDYDGNQNVTQRRDVQNGTTESFDYDFMNRLHVWTWRTSSTEVIGQQVRYDYDDLGNLALRKVLVGNGTDLQFTVTPSIAGPHAIVSSTLGAYGYDGNGNQTAAPGRTVQFNERDLPSTINQSGLSYTFSYDGSDSRARKSKSNGDVVIRLDDLYERRVEGGSTTHIYSLFALGKHVLEVMQSPPPALPRILAIHGGHLGSTELVTDVTDATRTTTETVNYEPFGQRIGLLPPQVNSGPLATGVRTGFTEQEHDEDLGLVDMKGRVYDPTQFRFISVDPIVASLRTGQALNGYSYVRGNPVTWRDIAGLEPSDDAVGPWTVFDPVAITLTHYPVDYVDRTPEKQAAKQEQEQPPPPPPCPDCDIGREGNAALAAGGPLAPSSPNYARNTALDLATGSAQRLERRLPYYVAIGLAGGAAAVAGIAAGSAGVAAATQAGRFLDIRIPWLFPFFYAIAANEVAPGETAPVATVATGFAEGSLGAARAASVLTKGGARVLGNLRAIKDQTVATAILQRGGGGNVVHKIATYLQHELVGNVANLAAQGDDEAITAIKLIKQASKKGQIY